MRNSKKNSIFGNFCQGCKDFFKNPTLYFDRSFSSGIGKQIGWLLAVFLFVLALLYVIYCLLPVKVSFGERFSYLVYQLLEPLEPTDKSMPFSFAVIVHVCGLIVLGGMLISVVSNILERRLEAYRNGETSYKLKDHIIIIGYNASVPSLIKTIRTENDIENDETFILVQSGQDSSEVRNQLQITLDEWMVKNTIVVHGLGSSEEDLLKLNIGTCVKVYIIGDSTLEAHDSMNLDCLSVIAKIWRECHPETVSDKDKNLVNKLNCNVLFEYQTLYSIFQFSELKEEINNAILFHPFNLHENWAKKVLVVGAADKQSAYKPLEGDEGFNENSKQHVHMIIIGMSRMGTALAVETAQTAHYPNFREDNDATRTHITFIDCDALEQMESFKSRFANVFDMMRWRYVDTRAVNGTLYTLTDNSWVNPIEEETSPYRHLGPNFTDLQWEFLDGRLESAPIRKYLTDAVNDKSAVTTIAVCLPDTQQATRAALYLPDMVLRNAHQVLIYQEESDAIARSVNNPNDPCTKFNNLVPFGMISDTYCNDFIGDNEGKWINAYWAKEFAPEDQRDNYRRAWNEKDEAWADRIWNNESVSNKWSSIHSANMLFAKLRSIGCTVEDNIENIRKAMEENMQGLVFTEHNRWVAEQLMAGFRPLFADEWETYKKSKKAKKKAEKAHGNICSNKVLEEVEPGSHDKDKQVTLALLEIIKK